LALHGSGLGRVRESRNLLLSPSRTYAAPIDGDAGDAKKLRGIDWFKAKMTELRNKDRKDIASLGATAFLTYGFVSNVNSVLLVATTWATYRASNPLLSPLSDTAIFSNPATWLPLKKEFMAFYIGYYATIGTILRPFRFALAAYLTPKFDKIYTTLKDKFSVPKPIVILLCTIIANVIFPTALLIFAVNAACFLLRVKPIP